MRARSLVPVLALALLGVASPLRADRSRSPIVLIVRILEADPRPAIPCGHVGRQPRDVRARVLAVEEGTWTGETILLRWRTCTSLPAQGVVPGARFRIRVNRRGHDARGRYLVHRSEPLP